MACKFENNDYDTAKQVVLKKIGPLKLSDREANKLAEKVLSDSTWDQLTDATSYGDSFLMASKGTFIREEGVILPNVQVSKTGGTAWIRDKAGARLYMLDNPLSFLPASKKTLFTNWALNTLLGTDAKVITNKELLALNEADAIEMLDDALYEDEMEDNLTSLEHVKLRDKMTNPVYLKALYKNVLSVVSQYSAKLDQDIEDLSESITKEGDSIDDRIKGGFEESATVDPNKRIADRLKLEFLRIPVLNSKDVAKRDSFFPGLPKFMNAKEVHNILLPLLADTSEFYEHNPTTGAHELVTTYEHMRRKLNSITQYHPGMKVFLERLDASPELQTMLVTSFSLSLMDYMSVFQGMVKDEDGDMSFQAKIQRTGEKTSKNAQLQQDWATGLEAKFTKQSKNVLSSLPGEVKKAVDLYNTLKIKRGKSIVYSSELVGMYKALGLELSDGAAKKLLKDNKSALLDLDLIMRFLANTQKAKKKESLITRGALNNPVNLMAKELRAAIEAESSFRPNFIDSSESGKGGKQYYKFAPTGGIHKVLNALKAGDRQALAKMKEHPMYQGSLWIDHLTDPTASIEVLIERAKAIEPIVLNLVGNESGDRADNKELTEVDQTIAQINFAAAQFKVGHSATFLTPTPADKPRAMGFRGAPVIGTQSGDDFLFNSSSEFVTFEKGEFKPNLEKLDKVNEEVVDQFVKYYRAEENRIAFERAAYAQHVIKVGQHVNELETSKGIEYSPEQWQAEFNRFMPLLADENFELISVYHYRDSYINSKLLSSTELKAAVIAGNANGIGLAMTGNAGKMTMFKAITTEDNLSPTDAQVKQQMAKSLAKRYADTLTSLMKDGIIEVEHEDGTYTLDSNYIDHASTGQAVQFWLFNNMIQNVEYNKMFTSDLAMYKNAVDYFKRVPATYSDGKYLALLNNTVQEVTYNVATVTDVEAPSEYYENMRSILADENPSKDQSWLANGYLHSLNHADGQGYITPNRWKFLMKRLNKWNAKTGELFDRMVNDPFSLTDEDLHDVNALMKPLKGVASGINTSGNTPSQRYIKYSQAVIIPAFAKGTAMEEVLHMMEPHGFNADGTYNTNKEYSEKEHKETTHELIFESGIKIGGSNITDIHEIPDASRPHEFAIAKDAALMPVAYKNADWKLQQDLPDNMIHPTLLASQIQANIKANIKVDGDYKIPGYGTFKGSQILRLLDITISNMSDHGAAKVRRKFGLDENFNIENLGSFSKALLLQVKDKASTREKEAIETGFNLNALPSIGGTGVTILMSMVAKAAVKLKTNGGSFVQISGVFSNMTSDEQRQILLFREKGVDSLKPPRKVRTGMARGQAFLGYSSVAKYFPMTKGEDFETYGVRFREELRSGRLPKEIFSVGIGYRIPNQNMSSNDSLEIIGILPPTMGDSIVLYDEIVTKTGSDFDIDKMYMILNSVKTHIKNDYQLLQADLAEFDINDAESARMYVAAMLGDEGGEQMIVDVMGAQLGHDKFNIGKTTWRRDLSELVLGIYNYDKSQLSDELVEVLEQKGIIDKYTVPNALADGKENRGPEAEANALVSMYRSILESEHAAADVVSPLDFDWLKDFVGALGLNTTPDLAEDMLFTDPIFQTKVKAAFKAGKLGVAQSANHVSHHPLAQEAGLRSNTPISVLHGTRETVDGIEQGLHTLDREWEVPMDPSGEIKNFDFLTKTDRDGTTAPIEVKRLKITQTLSSFLNAYVDIAKDPYVTAGNFNKSTYNVAALMMRAGMQKEVVLAFIASEPIKHMVESVKPKNVLGPNFETRGEKFTFDGYVGKSDTENYDADVLAARLPWDDAGDVYLTPTQMMLYAKNGTLTKDESLRHGTKDEYLDMDSVFDHYVGAFKYLRFVATDLSKTMRAHKLSNGVGITISEKVIKQNEMDESLDQDSNKLNIESVKRLRVRDGMRTSTDVQWEHTMDFLPNLKHFMVQFDPRFDAFLNDASLYFNGRLLSIKDQDFGNLIEKQGMNSLYSHTSFGLRTKGYTEKLFGKTNDSLGSRVLQAKKSAWGKNNDFLQNLSLNTQDKKFTFINFAKLSDNDPNTKDHYMEQFEEIKAIDPELYRDLLSYNMYSSGVSVTRNSFTQFIPTSVSYEGRYDDQFAKAKLKLHKRLNNDTVREIALNNMMTLIPTLPGFEDGIVPGTVSSHRFSLTSNTKDKAMTEFKSALKLVQGGAYSMNSKKWVDIMNLTLPGSTMTQGGKAALGANEYPPIVSYQGRQSQQQAFIKHRTKKGYYMVYEFMGTVYSEKGYANDIYVLAEQLGYAPRTGGRMYEYGVNKSAIESNHYFNLTKEGETKAKLLRAEMDNFKSAVKFALSAEENATADEADEFIENC